jgi:hypothetical protein
MTIDHIVDHFHHVLNQLQFSVQLSGAKRKPKNQLGGSKKRRRYKDDGFKEFVTRHNIQVTINDDQSINVSFNGKMLKNIPVEFDQNYY